MSRVSYCLAWSLGALVVAGGCAQWTTSPPAPNSPLAAAQMSADTVALEVAFVELPSDAHQGQYQELLWQRIDEQHVDCQLRTRLHDNGFRCGVVGTPLPDELRRLLDRAQPEPQVDGDPEQMRASQKRIQIRAGRGKLVASNQPRDLVALTNDRGQVRGQSYEQGQCIFVLRTYPQGDGRVQLQITPEIEYGQARTRIVGTHERGTWLFDSGRERKAFGNLQIDTLLSPGQTLVIGCTPQAKGLGSSFFHEPSGGETVKKMILIRLAQTQLDDLFAPDTALEALVTPSE